jgi:hypothetical protein
VIPVPRKVWLQASVVMPAALARRRTICQALVRCSRSPLSCAPDPELAIAMQQSPERHPSSTQLVLVWQEVGGPRVEAPKKSGYGTSVVRDHIPYELGGTVDLRLPRGSPTPIGNSFRPA